MKKYKKAKVNRQNFSEGKSMLAVRHLESCFYAYSLFVFGGQRSEVQRWLSSADLQDGFVFPSLYEKRVRAKMPVHVDETWIEGFQLWTSSPFFDAFAPYYVDHEGIDGQDDDVSLYGTEFVPSTGRKVIKNARLVFFNTNPAVAKDANRRSNVLLPHSGYFTLKNRYSFFLVDPRRWPAFVGNCS